MRKTLGCIRKADEEFGMIEKNDVICVAVSGGKDSMLLLKAMSIYRRFARNPFELKAICVNVGFDNMDFTGLESFCRDIDVDLSVVDTNIADVVFDIRKETNPCSLCSKMKRAALNEEALKLGSRKICYGHHRDDLIESFLLSLFYEGRIHTFRPVTYLDRTGVYSLRPLIYAREADIIHAVKTEDIPVVKSGCPVDGYTRREDMKELVKDLRKRIKKSDDRMFTAILNNLDKMN